MDTTTFYKQIATITRQHFGSTAERFVIRLIRSHSGKDSQTFQPKSLSQLINWIELAMRTVYSDQHAVDTYIHDLHACLPANLKNSPDYDKKI
ncbi:MAG TPA: hypothetical protein VLG92_01395 [Candidatus Saccharimonadia bacterium]|nr:hypothetical protein [Candidatus Saccharimonadia bacterium]